MFVTPARNWRRMFARHAMNCGGTHLEAMAILVFWQNLVSNLVSNHCETKVLTIFGSGRLSTSNCRMDS